MDQKPIISIKEARKIMGKDARKLSDEQLENHIKNLDMIIMLQLGMVPNV